MDLVERALVAMVEEDRRERRKQREEIKRLKALFKEREEEFARQLERSKLQLDPAIEDGTQNDPTK